MDSLRGQLLVASPGLLDPNFRRTVVLITEHGDEGALGLVLNRPAEITVEEAVPMLADLVDDDERVREYVRVNLEMEGYSVREAGNADEGLAVLEDVSPDLVLLDVMMPEVDGWEMLRRVQERHGVGAIPVVMFSGKVDEGAAEEATARGAQGFLGKPFDPQQLIERAKAMLPG